MTADKPDRRVTQLHDGEWLEIASFHIHVVVRDPENYPSEHDLRDLYDRVEKHFDDLDMEPWLLQVADGHGDVFGEYRP